MNNFNFSRYKLQKNGDDYTLILYFDHSTEFANELSNENNDNQEEQKENFIYQVKDFVFEKFPNLKVTTVKIVIGATLFSSFSINYALAETTTNTQSYSNYVVKAGDTLWKIANQYGTTVDALRSLNNLTSDVIYVGQNIKIPEKYEKVSVVLNGENKEFSPSSYLIGDITYVPVRQIAEELGASIWYNGDSRTVGINREDLSIAFVIGASSARVNGERVNMAPSKLINGTTYVPVRFIADSFGLSHRWDSNSRSVYLTSPLTTTYTVKPGDSLWLIANSFGITISALKDVNGITSDTIYVGQELRIPPKDNQVTEPTQPVTTNPPNQTYTEDTVTYITHTVEQGDNPWNLSIEYGIPMTELLEENHLTTESVLSLGQQLTIPVHHIPVKPVISEKYGELLDWWTEAQYVFPINKTARVIDFETGRSFYVKRTIGANHSDTEPLTAQDAAIIKDIWGGEYSWDKRAVIIEVDGRRLAASMASMPHSMQFITDNNFDGHFDIHFLNSTRHKDGQMTEEHQRQVKIAAGLITP